MKRTSHYVSLSLSLSLVFRLPGTNNIPGPPEDVHATSVASTSISLAWTAPTNSAEQSKSAPTDLATGDELAAGAAVAAAGDASDATTTTSPDSTSVPDASAGDNIDFVVQYGKVNNMTKYETVAKLENVSTPSITNKSILLPNRDM